MKSYQKIKRILSGAQRKRIYLLWFPMVVSALSNIAGIALIMPFLSIIADPEMIQKNKPIKYIYDMIGFSSTVDFTIFIGACCFLMVLITSLFTILTIWKSTKVVYDTGSDLTSSLYASYLENNYEFYIKNNNSELLNNLFILIPNICQKYILAGIEMVSGAVSILAIILLILIVDPVMAFVSAGIFGGSYIIVYKKIKRKIAKNSADIVNANKEVVQEATESFGAIKEIKLKNIERIFIEAIKPSLEERANKTAFNFSSSVIPKYILELIAFGSIILLTTLMIYTGRDVSSIIATLALYVYAGYRMMPALQKIFYGMNSMNSVSADIDTVYHSYSQIQKGQRGRAGSLKRNIECLLFKDSYQISKLSYCYPGRDKHVLSNLDLTIKYREVIGIVGSTGSGKSTLIDIILGLLTPVIGSIAVDGVILDNKSKLMSWQSKIGYVPQNIFLADKSIKENIALGVDRDNICMKKIRRAAKMASLDKFVEKELPESYDTTVGERGLRLSGGQIQRIGIARALYNDPEILILDEATSSLDNKTEAAVMQSIYQMKAKVTMVIVAHRLTTLDSCDCIYRLKDGHVTVERQRR